MENQMTQLTEKRLHGEVLSLYEQDFLLWSEETAAKLRARDFENLDLENLIEEVESLGRSDRKELLNRLVVIFEHLLKRLYVQLPNDYNGWERTIRTQRTRLIVLLKGSPSLKSIWQENVEDAWEIALKNVRKEYSNAKYPDRFPYSSDIDSILDRDFWEE